MSSPATNLEEKPTIMIVDDSRVMRVAFKKILSADYNIVMAEHGQEAWDMLQKESNVQVIFSDLNMPVMNGYGLLKKIRESEDKSINSIPIIIITGKDDVEETKEEVLQGGANDFIAKPFDSTQLKARAKSFLNLKQTTEKLEETTEKLEQEAAVDPITGLGTQAYFEVAVGEALAELKRHGGRCTCMYVDIVEFNKFFIKYGKNSAYTLLNAIGKRIGKIVRAEDKCARIGLARYAIMLIQCDTDGAEKLAQRIYDTVTSIKVNVNNTKVSFNCHIGMFEPMLEGSIDYDFIHKSTEECLYSAGKNGGSDIVIRSEHLADGPVAAVATKEGPLTVAEALNLLNAQKLEQIKDSKEVLLNQMLPLLEHVLDSQEMLDRMIGLLASRGVKFS